MKPDIHPNYRPVVFKDNSADFAILTRSTVETKETITWTDGKEYPLVRVDISSQSHPFYTGKQNIVDTAGRVDRFKRKYGKKSTAFRDKKPASSRFFYRKFGRRKKAPSWGFLFLFVALMLQCSAAQTSSR